VRLAGVGAPGARPREVAAAAAQGPGLERREPAHLFRIPGSIPEPGLGPAAGFVRGESKFIDQPIPEVYDLAGDPNEERNIVSRFNLGRLRADLAMLMKRLDHAGKTTRSARLDVETERKMRSSDTCRWGQTDAEKSVHAQDDLKTMLPVQTSCSAESPSFQAGQQEEGIRQLRDVIAMSPAFILAYNHLATIFVEKGRIQDAVAILEQGLKDNAGHIRLLAKLGVILAENGDPRRAIALLEGCVEKESFDPST